YFLISSRMKRNKKSNILNRIKEKIFRIREKIIIKRKLKDYILTGNYDLIIGFSEQFDQYLSFNKISIPTMRWVHSSINLNKFSSRRKNLLKKYDKIITITDEMEQQLLSLEIESNKITTLYNPIDFNNIRTKSEYESDIKITSKSYLVQVARLDSLKRHSDLIDIFAKLVEKGIQEDLYIIGKGDEYVQLKTKISQLNLENRCFLLGEVENPYPYMKNARLFLHTSEKEGLPTVLLESMALGVPVVAMDCPTGPKDILGANSEYGKLIPMHNKEMFIDAVLELLNNDELRQYYSRQSLIRVQDFSSEKISQQIDSLFKQVILEHHKKNELPKP
ncbi:glycosyltransferase, partial [Ursidibacter arcticus]